MSMTQQSSYRGADTVTNWKLSIVDFYQSSRYTILFACPIFVSLLLFPYINPYSIQDFESNFKIILISKRYCDEYPQACYKLLNSNSVKSKLMVVKHFKHYEKAYLRHYSIEKLDRFILQIFNLPFPRMLMLLFSRLVVPEFYELNNDEVWERAEEALVMATAIVSASSLHMIKGMLLSKMWIFLLSSLLVIIGGSWVTLSGPIKTAWTSLHHVF